MAETRNTDAEIERRVTEIHTLMLAGVRRAEILRHASKWDCSSRTVDSYMARAAEEIKNQATFDREAELGMVVTQLRTLFRQAQQTGDTRASLAIVKQYSELLGLNAAARVELTGAGGGALKIAVEEWKASIEQMRDSGGKI